MCARRTRFQYACQPPNQSTMFLTHAKSLQSQFLDHFGSTQAPLTYNEATWCRKSLVTDPKQSEPLNTTCRRREPNFPQQQGGPDSNLYRTTHEQDTPTSPLLRPCSTQHPYQTQLWSVRASSGSFFPPPYRNNSWLLYMSKTAKCGLRFFCTLLFRFFFAHMFFR